MTQPTPPTPQTSPTPPTHPSFVEETRADPYVLQGSASAVVATIALKQGGVFVVCDTRGDLPASEQETGLFWRGMRFLRTCDLFLEGRPLIPLSHSVSDEEGSCVVDLTNPYLHLGPPQSASQPEIRSLPSAAHAPAAPQSTDGDSQRAPAAEAETLRDEAPFGELQQGTLHVRRLLAIKGRRLTQSFDVTSFSTEPVEVTLGLKLGADFRDMFEVRGLDRAERGVLQPMQLTKRGAVLAYEGRDDIERITHATFTPAAHTTHADAAFWRLTLLRGETQMLQITIEIAERDPHGRSAWPQGAHSQAHSQAHSRARPPVASTQSDPFAESWQGESPALAPTTALATPTATGKTVVVSPTSERAAPNVVSDNVFFNRLLSRGLHDLVMMTTMTPEGLYPYGGIPWYVCPFGRDGLITSIEFLPWFPEVAKGTLSFLAAHQGVKEDPFTEEEPGKILHEYRQGEMANCREIPFIPYYGSVDATPLFLVALERYIRWTNDLELLRRLWPNAQAAAQWLLTSGDVDGDGFIEYQRRAETGLVNQGWKDSWDAISHHDGSYAQGAIALCEAQSYAYAAYLAMAYLARRMGQPATEAQAWEARATTLQTAFVRQFWWPDQQVFYLALDGAKAPCAVVSSNAGQCLWTGIVPDALAEPLINRMLQDDMYTEWGIRTLSSREARYNPMSYHNGSVWPHDTALIGMGAARYGRSDVASQLLGNLYGVSLYYEGARLPELFCGFARRHGYGPTRYPVACAPQSWAAGAPFLLLAATLGFEPVAEQQRLSLRHPTLPTWLERLDLHGLRLGALNGRLRFEPSRQGTAVILDEESEIDVSVLPRA